MKEFGIVNLQNLLLESLDNALTEKMDSCSLWFWISQDEKTNETGDRRDTVYIITL